MKKTATRVAAAPAVVRRPAPGLHGAWVRKLVVDGRSDNDIRELLADDDLPPLTDAELLLQRAAVRPPAKFNANKPSSADLAFLRSFGLGPFYPENDDARGALRLLRSPRPRELVEAAIIVTVPVELVLEILTTYLGFRVTATAVAVYRATFFHLDDLSRAQLRISVEERVRLAASRVGDGDPRAVRRAVSSDPRISALSVGRSELGWGAVLLAAGLPATRMQLSKTLPVLENLSAIRAAEAVLRGGRDDPQRALAFTSLLRTLRAIGETVREPGAQMEEHFRRFAMRLDESELPAAKDLRARGDVVSDGPTTLDEDPGDGPDFEGESLFGDDTGPG